MLLEKSLEKLNHRYMVGYDLSNKTAQISFCSAGQEEVETLPVVAGTQQYNIPAVLCKRHGVNQWFYGKEAHRMAQAGEGVLVENLLEKACRGETVLVEEQEYDAVTLLTLFVKKSFSLFSMIASPDKIEILVICTRKLDERTVDVLGQVAGGLGLKAKHIYFQNYRESFYYYMLHQPRELWLARAVIFDLEEKLISYTMECNRRTTPIVTFIQEEDYQDYAVPDWPEDEAAKIRLEKEMDMGLREIAREAFQNKDVSSVYLIGSGFQEEWCSQSLRFLCSGRRVFKGNNLYSKGASYGALERLCPSAQGKAHIFLGEEKLKSNIGLQIIREGRESYLALMDAGVNWYDAKCERELYLESGNSFYVAVTPLTHVYPEKEAAGKYPVRYEKVELDGLPERPACTTRLRLQMSMSDVGEIDLEVTDLGFGELIKSSGRIWKKKIRLNEG